jgi:predicted ester cyclase
MSTDANKEIARRWNEEFINHRQIDAIDRFLHPNYVGHPPGGYPHTPDRTRFKEVLQHLESTPDLSLQLEDLIAEGDKVVIRYTFHDGGKAVARGISIYRIEDGKIIEDWFHQTAEPEA